jgi:hypothetical protein
MPCEINRRCVSHWRRRASSRASQGWIAFMRSSLAALHCRHRDLRRPASMVRPMSAGLAAQLHQPGGCGIDAPAPIDSRHAPGEICAASIRPGSTSPPRNECTSANRTPMGRITAPSLFHRLQPPLRLHLQFTPAGVIDVVCSNNRPRRNHDIDDNATGNGQRAVTAQPKPTKKADVGKRARHVAPTHVRRRFSSSAGTCGRFESRRTSTRVAKPTVGWAL